MYPIVISNNSTCNFKHIRLVVSARIVGAAVTTVHFASCGNFYLVLVFMWQMYLVYMTGTPVGSTCSDLGATRSRPRSRWKLPRRFARILGSDFVRSFAFAATYRTARYLSLRTAAYLSDSIALGIQSTPEPSNCIHESILCYVYTANTYFVYLAVVCYVLGGREP